ncbi:hypothetical protein [Ruminococcus flavefaciens]|uniref:hypothetical protein n=1 Tax=Ruminococcus flavefaciens TaxID=1265 RepID=UPI0004912FF1|nr:hypothetical protein [Ruminococcus flavefaciens]
MNKRIILGIAAVLALSSVLTACDDKEKPEPKPKDTTVNEDTGDTLVTEPVYREYSEEDFKTITVTLNYPDKEPPVDVSSIDISGLDFGTKLPVCNTEENAKNYYEDMFSLSHIEYNWENLINEEAEGIASSCCMYDGKCYIVVEYKSFLTSNFDFSLFCYDEKSGKNEEVYSWSSKDINEDYTDQPMIFDDKLFYEIRNSSDNSNKVFAYDLNTGDVKTVYEEKESDVYVYFDHDSMDYPCLQLINNGGEQIDYLYYDETDESFVGDKTNDISGKIISTRYFGGVQYYIVKSDGKRKLDMICQYYHVSLSYTGGTIIYADDKKFLIKNEGSIHMYDLEKMEHYILDVTGMGTECTYCSGMLFTGNWYEKYKMPVYCIIPELGIAYAITDDDLYCGLKTAGDTVTFNSCIEYKKELKDETSGGIAYSMDKMSEVYTVTAK